MTPESAPDFFSDENKVFADTIWASFGETEVEALEALADKEEFIRDAGVAANYLNQLADQLAQKYDAFVVAAALAMLHSDWDRAVDEDA